MAHGDEPRQITSASMSFAFRPDSELPLDSSKKVSVLIVDLSKRYGGASTRTVAVANGMRQWNAAIAALDGSAVAQAARAHGIPVVAVGKHRADPRIALRIADAVRRGGYDLLDTQNIQSKVWASMAALLTGTALVSTLNSWYAAEHGGRLKGKAYSLIERLTSWRTDRYIVVSSSVRSALCDSGVAEARIDLIHNGIDILKEDAGYDAAAVRAALGVPMDVLLCTAVGRLVWAKGYSDLVEAFARVAREHPNATCVVVGDGELYADLMRRIQELGLSRRLLLVGYRSHEEVLNILRASDIFLMPSRSEGIPYALLEAGALGLPIVATRCGGIPEVISDGLQGLLAEPGDVQGVAERLAILCLEPDRARKLGASARRKIQVDFSLDAQVTATKLAYIRALEARKLSNGA